MSDAGPVERAEVWRRARQWTAALAGRVRRALQRSTTWGPLGLAVAVGLLSGAGAVALRGMIRGVEWLTDVSTGLPIPSELITISAPAVGLVAVTYLVRSWAPEAKGHGVPEVQFAIRMRGGRIRGTLITTREHERELRAWLASHEADITDQS